MNASVDSVFPEKYRTESPVYASRKGIQCVSYFSRYRQSGFSHLLLSPAGRFPAYQEPFPLWTESPSFCSDLRDSLEPDVHKHTAL